MDTKRALVVIYAGEFALMVLLAGESKGAEEGETCIPIRIGWQISSVTQGVVVQVQKWQKWDQISWVPPDTLALQ